MVRKKPRVHLSANNMVKLRFGALVSALLYASSALADAWTDPDTGIPYQSYIDPVHGFRISTVFPASTTGTELIISWTVPITLKWAGISLGGGMNSNLLILAWPYNGAVSFSPRYATNYAVPTVYTGPTITTIAPASKINSTHWKWTFRCQNCTSWLGGNLVQDGNQVMGWAVSTDPVTTPSSTSTSLAQHTDFGLWGQDTLDCHSANYATYLTGTGGGGGTSTTTSASPTTTSSGPTISATPYDYIVVGAGPAGIVVADRLSEAGKNVLLIEKGGPSTKATGGKVVPPWTPATDLTLYDIPGLFETEFSNPNPIWCTDVSPFAGCVTGGSSAVNGLLYWLPTDAEFDQSNGWPSGWQTPNTYISKVTSRLPSTDLPSPDGKRYLDQSFDVMSQVLAKQGYSNTTINSNRNQKDHVYGHPGYYIKGGKRNGVMDTYLQTALARPNFKYMMYTKVLSIVRNGATMTGVQTNNTAIGGTGIIPLTSKGRVILAGGVFGTSRLLFQSGIGPSDMIGIVANDATAKKYLPPSSQYINLPVGMNITDNPSVNLVFTHPSVDSYDNWVTAWAGGRSADVKQYVSSQTGVYAQSSPRLNSWSVYGGSDKRTRYTQSTLHLGACCFTPLYPYNTTQQFTITIYLSTGLTSRGRIGIDASFKGQVLKAPWLTDPVDTAVLTTALNDFLSTYNQVPNLTLISPYLNQTTMENHVKNTVSGSNHWTGSANIGTTSSNSVVDTNTKVWSTNNLFVVDASIFPGMPTGNPTGAILVAAEMAAAKILALIGGA